MNKRLEIIFSEIPACLSFADVGCDHGYIAKAVLDSGKCDDVVISDISAPSLNKAEKLLKRYIDCGKARAVVCDGLRLVPKRNTVLISGMGGEEIIKILSEAPFKTERLILSPMKNQDKVRAYLLENGYGITKDYTFCDQRFYHLIIAELGKNIEPYTAVELEFGRDNLKLRPTDFILYIKKELEKAETYKNKVVSKEDKELFEQRIKKLRGMINENQ